MTRGSVFDRVGGQPFFDELVERFYAGVIVDDLLAPMYPDDLTDSKRHLALFLGQYWGGPALYNVERGHPRLRMRHVPFAITKPVRDAWLMHMKAALLSLGDRVGDDDRAEFDAYFEMASTQLRNV